MSEEIKPKRKNEPLEIKLSEEETYALVSKPVPYMGLEALKVLDFWLEQQKK